MKYFIGLLILVGVGYATYAYVHSEAGTGDSTIINATYDGAWDIVLNPTSGGKCSIGNMSGTVVHGELKGILRTQDGVQSTLHIKVAADGVITNKQSTNIIAFDGLVYGGFAKGKWSDKYGCAGTFVMDRPQPISEDQYDAPKPPSKGQAAELEQETLE